MTVPTTQYRKKPVVIEAFQMTCERRSDNSEWPEWLGAAWNMDFHEVGAVSCEEWPKSDGTDRLVIRTLEGIMTVGWDDWIIRGVQGELYACKPDIFAATYEPALSAALAVEAGTDTEWTYKIQYGPDGEANYAWIYRGQEMVATMKTHHAQAVCSALTTSPASSAVEGEAVAYIEPAILETLKAGGSGVFPMAAVSGPSHRPGCTVPLYSHPAPTPVVIHFEEAGHYQLMTADVPTFTGQPMTVRPLRDMQTREIVGFQWDAVHASPAPHQEGRADG